MWNFISGIFGKGDNISKGLDMVDKGLDALVFTAEEKSVANQTILDWKLKWISATGAQSVARRVIAYVIVALWALMVVLAVSLTLLEMPEKGKFLFEVLRDIIHWPFITIIGFYFAAHIVRTNKK
ncbi:hypothetical protein KAR91_10005 [Candidatus Pacearchaeota archaeon]|nr:hypothetical protein [Candidatus Pacearchaeota archaeon]